MTPRIKKNETIQAFFERTQETRGVDNDTYEQYVYHRLKPNLSLNTRAQLAGLKDGRTIAKYDMIDDKERQNKT